MRLIYRERFKKNFQKLSPKLQKAFGDRLKIYLENPKHPLLKVHPLKGSLVGFRAFSIAGNCRVIFRLGLDFIEFVDIGTHNQVY